MLDDAGRDEAVVAVRIYLVLLVLRKPVDACYTTVGLDRRSAQGFRSVHLGGSMCVSRCELRNGGV